MIKINVLSSLVLMTCCLTNSNIYAANNILVIVADDLGVDMLPAVYQTDCNLEPATCSNGVPIITTSNIKTDTIEQLAQEGVSFSNVWSNPYCSATRATIQTGRYGYRTDVGRAGHDLKLSETTIPEVLSTVNYTSAAIGKWHLGGGSSDDVSPTHPTDTGYDFYAGNLYGALWNGFNNWSKTSENGTKNEVINTYAAEDKVLDAVGWMQGQASVATPWFMWFSFNLPHSPYHVPPIGQFSNTDLLSAYNALSASDQALARVNCKGEVPGEPIIPEELCYIGMIEAMDHHMGELLSAVNNNDTTVIFVGDNGTPRVITQSLFGFSNAKGTVFEHGVHVPMIIKSPEITQAGKAGGILDILVNTTDLYSTILELAGTTNTTSGVDSISFASALAANEPQNNRSYVYAEVFDFFYGMDDSGNEIRFDSDVQQAVMNQDGFKAIKVKDLTNTTAQMMPEFNVSEYLADHQFNYFYNFTKAHETNNIYDLVDGFGPSVPNKLLKNYAGLRCEIELQSLNPENTFYTGTVSDENSVPLFGARLTLTDFASNQVGNVRFTNSDGFYMSQILPFNTFFRLDATMPGHSSGNLITRRNNCRVPNDFTLVTVD